MKAEELTAAREAANLSKYALARRAGLDRSEVTHMENGQRRITDKMAARLREALRQQER